MTPDERCAVYEQALNKIASWSEGPEVTDRFGDPHSARIARKALQRGAPPVDYAKDPQPAPESR